jgi:hypothetical protein
MQKQNTKKRKNLTLMLSFPEKRKTNWNKSLNNKRKREGEEMRRHTYM